MKNYSRAITLASELSAAVAERNGKLMQENFDALESLYKAEFGGNLSGYNSFLAFSRRRYLLRICQITCSMLLPTSMYP